MKIDSLTKFDELVGCGMDATQARAIAHGLSEAGELDFNVVATKSDLQTAINNLEWRLKIYFVYIAAGTLVAGFFIPMIQKYLGLT